MAFMPRALIGAIDLTQAPFAVVQDETDTGAPVNVYEEIASQLRDGQIISSRRTSNREVVVQILIEGADLAELAQHERTLAIECDKQTNTLTLDPGDGFGRSSIYDVFRPQLTQIPVHGGEQALLRRYQITFQALPYPRSVASVIDDADTPAVAGTVVASFDTTTGWAAGSGGVSYTTDSTNKVEGTASVRATVSVSGVMATWTARQSQSRHIHTGLSVATGAGGYLSMAVKFGLDGGSVANSVYDLEQQIGGAWVRVANVFSSETLALGFVRWAWIATPGVTVTGLRFQVAMYGQPQAAYDPYVWFDALTLSPVATTDQVITKGFDVQGSARAAGSLHVFAPSDGVALGQVLVSTVTNDEIAVGFTPDTRRFVTAGTTTADTAALLGSYYAITTAYGPLEIKVPTSMLRPGAYTPALVTRDAVSVTVESQLFVGGVAVGTALEETGTLAAASGGYQFLLVDTMYFPTIPVEAGADAQVRLRFKSTATVRLAECFLIPEAADFTITDCGTGTVSGSGASSHLWLDAPTPALPQGAVWRGPAANRVNARSAWPNVVKPGNHIFTPGGMKVFLCSLGALGPKVHQEYFPRWFTNAAS